MDIITENDCWEVVESFLGGDGFVKHQLDSFNKFMNETIQQIVDETDVIEINCDTKQERAELEFHQVHISKPIFIPDGDIYVTEDKRLYKFLPNDAITPEDARLGNLTYAASIYVDITMTTFDIRQQKRPRRISFPRVYIGDIPVMVRSRYCHIYDLTGRQIVEIGECENDTGGYFIVNGHEKVIIAQERMSDNETLIYERDEEYRAEIRSVPERLICSGTKTSLILANPRQQSSDRRIGVTIPYIRTEIPLTILFKALGINCDKDMVDCVLGDTRDLEMLEILKDNISETSIVQDQNTALMYIGCRGARPGNTKDEHISYAKNVLRDKFLAHIGTTELADVEKIYFLGYMTRKLLLTALGYGKPHDTDHYGYKRLDLAGPLFAALFKKAWADLVKNLTFKLNLKLERGSLRCADDFYALFSGLQISEGFRYALATGNWVNVNGGGGVREGVAQLLNRLSYNATVSNLRRINSPLGGDGRVLRPRYLHNTHWGIVCPSETPEGAAVGLVKNLALLAIVSVGTDTETVLKILTQHEYHKRKVDVILLTRWDGRTDVCKIFINGSWVAVVERASAANLVETLRECRRERAQLPHEVSIAFDRRELEIQIFTDAGRLMRPLFIVDPGTRAIKLQRRHVVQLRDKSLTWRHLLLGGIIEYVDALEAEDCLIATNTRVLRENKNNLRYTHCEIHPSVILGVCAAQIPFADHNQSPRNTYQSAMGKQSMGTYAVNYQRRMDAVGHVLNYPQRPLVSTRVEDFIGGRCHEMSAGVNAIVAIMSYTGYNQEDSIILNRSSLERGLFTSSTYRTFKATALRSTNNVEEFMKPVAKCHVFRKGTYDKLDDNGLPEIGVRVRGDDAIIGKVSLNGAVKDESIFLKPNEAGIVDRVMVTNDRQHQRIVKVKIRSTRTAEIGDKFASRHGQKGTCGLTLNEEDMPFAKNGMVPDIIINPHAIPSRMTIGHLIETYFAKAVASEGAYGDGTAFQYETENEECTRRVKFSHRYTRQLLRERGFEEMGNEILHDGATGRKIETRVFVGPVYYQRLKHMVEDKIHARARGPLQNLVRQPTEGRARDGGLRFGEMERDCQISHGAAQFLHERLFSVSDPYRVNVCGNCGLVGTNYLDVDGEKSLGANVANSISETSLTKFCSICSQRLTDIVVRVKQRDFAVKQCFVCLRKRIRGRFNGGHVKIENDVEKITNGCEICYVNEKSGDFMCKECDTFLQKQWSVILDGDICSKCHLPSVSRLQHGTKICLVCLGIVAENEKRPAQYKCKSCVSSGVQNSSTKLVDVPYAAKLLFQELMSMNIFPRLTV